jgi:hypothetical protein
MKCPFCLNAIHPSVKKNTIYNPYEIDCANVFVSLCPSCKEVFFSFFKYGGKEIMIFPRTGGRNPAPKEVDDFIAEDYNEACLILNDSPKASAALSRRCLQSILRLKVSVKKSTLENEINEAIPQFPSYIQDNLRAIQKIGNFAAHPEKSTSTGEILPVEPHEAEWCLDILESLFDFLYVQPAIAERKKDELNKKLQEIGKPTI